MLKNVKIGIFIISLLLMAAGSLLLIVEEYSGAVAIVGTVGACWITEDLGWCFL